MPSELEKAFQAINAYNGLCVPPQLSKEGFMVAIVNHPDPYNHVIKCTAKRILHNIKNRKIVASEIQRGETIITFNEALFIKVHCNSTTLTELHNFINGPFTD